MTGLLTVPLVPKSGMEQATHPNKRQQFSIWSESLKMARPPGRKTGRAMVTKAVGLLF